MVTYTYSLDDDFINGINPTCLDRTIREYGFPFELDSVNVEYGIDEVTILFNEPLSASDKEDLDGLISVHNPLETCDFENRLTIGPTKIDFTLSDHSSHEYIYNNSTSWIVGRSFIFDGTSIWTPKKFSVIASLKKAATGTVRLYDATNNNYISEISWTDVDKTIQSTETFINLPTETALIEIQLKTSNQGNDARLHYLALY